MGKKKLKTTSTETVGPSTFAQPYITDAASVLKPAYDKSMGLLEKYTPQLDAGVSYFGNAMNQGNDSNPYLDAILSKTRDNVSNQVDSSFSMAGRYGSDAHTSVLTRELADAENNARYSDWYNSRSRADDAALKQAGLIQSIVGMPQGVAGGYADNTGGLLGRYLTSNGTSVTKQSDGLLGTLAQIAQIAGAVASRAAAPSDRRLKMDISKVGEAEDGLGIYTYRYVTDSPDDPLRKGVMADEVEKLRPWALGPTRNGFATVDYGAL